MFWAGGAMEGLVDPAPAGGARPRPRAPLCPPPRAAGPLPPNLPRCCRPRPPPPPRAPSFRAGEGPARGRAPCAEWGSRP